LPIAVAPHGETITTIQPGRTDRLTIEFLPPLAGQQFLVFNPLDTAATQDRDPITLTVAVEQISAPETVSRQASLSNCRKVW
jgi:hypothetical protein